MDVGFCGMPFAENEFLSIFRSIEAPKDKISFLTTTKALYRQIPLLGIDKIIALRYLCNNYEKIGDEGFLSPLLLKPFPPNAVELKCGDPSFPLQIQFLVFSRIFSLGKLGSPLKLLIDSKTGPKEGEVDALLQTIDTIDPFLGAIDSLELAFMRVNDDLDLISDKLPNLKSFVIKPIEALKMDAGGYQRYNKLFSERNLMFLCDMELYFQSSKRKIEEAWVQISSFMSSTFNGVNPSRVIYSIRNAQRGPLFGFYQE